jgi:hypothetical protein
MVPKLRQIIDYRGKIQDLYVETPGKPNLWFPMYIYPKQTKANKKIHCYTVTRRKL